MFLRLWYYPILKKHFLSCKSLKRNDLMRVFWAGPFLRTPSTKEDAWRRIGHFFSSLENLKNLNSNFALACLCVKNENGFFFSAKIKNHRWKTSSARRLQKEVFEWRLLILDKKKLFWFRNTQPKFDVKKIYTTEERTMHDIFFFPIFRKSMQPQESQPSKRTS